MVDAGESGFVLMRIDTHNGFVIMSDKKRRELAEADADLAYWEAIFKPIGYRIHGWTYRNHASVISPTGKYVAVDDKIIELVAAARSQPARRETGDRHRPAVITANQ